MSFSQALQQLQRGETGAVGWVLVGAILGVILVIYLIVKVIGAIF